MGFALKETLHVGARFFGSYMPTGGYNLFVGPSVSAKIGEKLWVGGSLILGWGAQNAKITGAKGDVPSDWVDYNGTDEVDVTIYSSAGTRLIPEQDDVGFGFSFGASAEVSYTLLEFGHGKSLMPGSLLLSGWPTFVKTLNGFAVALPVGVGYRFH